MALIDPQQWSPKTSGAVFMVLGSVLVIATMLLINRFAEGPDQRNEGRSAEFAVERQQQTPPPDLPPPPPPPPRRAPPTPPAVALNTNLSGIDFGLPAFSGDELGSLQDQLLGDTSDVVMTNDLVDSPPRPVEQSPMEYPSNARSQGLEGYVVLSLLISASGEIEKVEVLESTPSGVFEDAALAGIRDWRFEPAQYQGRSVKVWARQRIRFDLG
jgi:protein TonB